MKFKNLCHGLLGVLAVITAASATSYAGVLPILPTQVPEADPGVLLAIGVSAVGYLAGVVRYRSKK